MRPLEWKKEIEQSFAKLSARPPMYTQVGKEEYGFYLMPEGIESYVKKLLENEQTKLPIKILDIGTGNGDFIYNLENKFGNNVEVIGITAFDMREANYAQSELEALKKEMEKLIKDKSEQKNLEKIDQKIESIDFFIQMKQNQIKRLHKEYQSYTQVAYAIHNCETLFAPNLSLSGQFSIEPGKFDLIVSSTTFMHVLDPAGAWQQAYEALNENGVLIIDRFTLKGLAENLKVKDKNNLAMGAVDYHKALIAYLKQTGYEVEAEYYTGMRENKSSVQHEASEAIQCLRIKKTKPTLELPVEYAQEIGVYVPNLELKEFFAKLPKDQQEEQRKQAIVMVEDIKRILPEKFDKKLIKLSRALYNADGKNAEIINKFCESFYDAVLVELKEITKSENKNAQHLFQQEAEKFFRNCSVVQIYGKQVSRENLKEFMNFFMEYSSPSDLTHSKKDRNDLLLMLFSVAINQAGKQPKEILLKDVSFAQGFFSTPKVTPVMNTPKVAEAKGIETEKIEQINENEIPPSEYT